ncbi:MAG: hypothetical protein ACI8W8_003841 [Rhodothermales bacterium]
MRLSMSNNLRCAAPPANRAGCMERSGQNV